MARAPFMPLYTSDYLGDTGHLSTEEHGAYLLILMQMWNAGGSLPADPSKLARVARCSTKKWLGMADTVLAFFTVHDGWVSNDRLTKERQKVQTKSDSRASAGAKGGAAKALKTKKQGLANAVAKPCHLPDTITIEDTIANAIVERTVDFDGAEQPKRKPSPRGVARGSRISPTWAPQPQDYAFASNEGMSPKEINDEADRFRDYWTAKSGREAAKLDWSATWRNWIRSDHRKRSGSRAGNTGSNGGRPDAFDRLAERLSGGAPRPEPRQHDDAGPAEIYVIDAGPARVAG